MEEYETELEKRNVLRLSNEESHKLTKECIQTALVDLMTKKPYEKITISEIITRSGVSRSAFYRNYSSKKDVVNEICEETFMLFKEYADAKCAREGTYSFFLGLFSAVKKHEKSIRLLLQANIQQIFPETISEQRSLSETIWPSDSPEKRYRNLALEGACNKILLDWFKNGMKESVEYMAQFCSDLARRI